MGPLWFFPCFSKLILSPLEKGPPDDYGLEAPEVDRGVWDSKPDLSLIVFLDGDVGFYFFHGFSFGIGQVLPQAKQWSLSFIIIGLRGFGMIVTDSLLPQRPQSRVFCGFSFLGL